MITKPWARIIQSSLFVTLVLALIVTPIARADVELYYFQAKYRDNVVILEWQTGPEIDLLGFFVTRSTAQYGAYTRISNLITNKGDETLGASYDFTDQFIMNETPYWYRLEIVEVANRVSFSGLVYIVTGSERSPTPTMTLTTTPTRSPTATESSSSVEVLPTSTSIPTATFVPGTLIPSPTGIALLTSTATMTSVATEPISPTSTLVPLPDITLQFPTPISKLDISREGSAKAQDTSTNQQRKDILIAIGRVIFLGFIVLIWLILVVWFYLASRRVE